MPSNPISQSPISHPSPYDEDLPPAALVDSPAAFQNMLDDISGETALALDTESNSLYRYFYQVCLIQISTSRADYLVDPLRLPDIAPLGAVLADPTRLKILHAAENDILMLKRDFGFAFANIFDTMLAARILGWPQVGLAALLAQRFGLTLDKREQLTDWGRRPLTPAQLSYARLDSRYLLPLQDVLVAELQTRRRGREAQEAFEALTQVVYVEKPFDPDGFWRTKGARDLRPTEFAVLRELYLWRDSAARALDRPPFKVIGDDGLVQLSQRQPQRLADLHLSPRQIEQFGRALLDAIARGRAAPAPQPPARNHDGNGRPDPEALARFDRLRAWRARRAAERAVDTDIVLTNDTLMAIARAAPASLEALAALRVMGNWKLEEYGGDILRTLHGS